MDHGKQQFYHGEGDNVFGDKIIYHFKKQADNQLFRKE